MKKIVIFNTSYGTLNNGDFIICDSAKKQLNYILDNNFLLNVSTHTPVLASYQLKSSYENFFDVADYKFLFGTNIIKKNMLRKRLDWNVNMLNCKPYIGTILVGAGIDGNFEKVNLYTKKMYQKILNKNYIHSTRDEKTKRFLESIGIKAINTGCVTMWDLTPDFCKQIETKKSKAVIFTLTDYRKDQVEDQKLINILKENYEKVFFWIQGSNDFNYFNTFDNIQDIELIGPSMEEYDNFLTNNKVDYVGTRLHAGIYAMKHKRRTIIISVDNRANDMKETYNLITISRKETANKLPNLINSTFETKLNIDTKKIEEWKKQFNEKK